MHRPTRSRWYTPRRPYAGGWCKNPWLNALVASRSDGDELRDEQTAAVTTWENEGGSLSASALSEAMFDGRWDR